MGWKYNCECHLVTLILVLVVLTLSFFLQTIIHFNVSFSSYFIWSGAQKLSLHMLLVSFHRREGQCICSFSEENITLNARDLNSLLPRIILKIYYDKCSWRDNPGCCLSEIRMRKQVLKKILSMSFLWWENGKKHLELSVNSEVQPENSPVGSLHPLSVFICCPFSAASSTISFRTAVILCFIGC